MGRIGARYQRQRGEGGKMDDNRPFEASETDIALSGDGTSVRLIFNDDSRKSREVILRRKWLPMFAAQIQKNIEPGQIVPIDKGSLQIGQSFSLQGFHAHRLSDGGATIVLFVDLPDQGRVVTIPMDMTPKDLSTLLTMLDVKP
jgi:hypothetical protein